MVSEHPAKTQEQSERPSRELSPDFYLRLLNAPVCKQGKPCDGCGRCEH